MADIRPHPHRCPRPIGRHPERLPGLVRREESPAAQAVLAGRAVWVALVARAAWAALVVLAVLAGRATWAAPVGPAVLAALAVRVALAGPVSVGSAIRVV